MNQQRSGLRSRRGRRTWLSCSGHFFCGRKKHTSRTWKSVFSCVRQTLEYRSRRSRDILSRKKSGSLAAWGEEDLEFSTIHKTYRQDFAVSLDVITCHGFLSFSILIYLGVTLCHSYGGSGELASLPRLSLEQEDNNGATTLPRPTDTSSPAPFWTWALPES